MTIHITPREFQVWQLTATGLTYREIGARLGICRDTVWRYRQNVMAELQVRNPVGLALAAVAHGVVTLAVPAGKVVVGRTSAPVTIANKSCQPARNGS